jgi:hypothetical protein
MTEAKQTPVPLDADFMECFEGADAADDTRPCVSATAADDVPMGIPVKQEFTSTPIGGTVGSQTKVWKVTVQQGGARMMHCHRCKMQFEADEVRIHSASNAAGNRRYHLGCVDATIKQPKEIVGYDQLVQGAKTQVDNHLRPCDSSDTQST